MTFQKINKPCIVALAKHIFEGFDNPKTLKFDIYADENNEFLCPNTLFDINFNCGEGK
jgi:hypothetical protein